MVLPTVVSYVNDDQEIPTKSVHNPVVNSENEHTNISPILHSNFQQDNQLAVDAVLSASHDLRHNSVLQNSSIVQQLFSVTVPPTHGQVKSFIHGQTESSDHISPIVQQQDIQVLPQYYVTQSGHSSDTNDLAAVQPHRLDTNPMNSPPSSLGHKLSRFWVDDVEEKETSDSLQ